MATLSLPGNDTSTAFTFQCALEGRIYNFRFWWNGRQGAWYLDLYDSDNALIIAGQTVTVDWSWLRNVLDSRKPLGDIIALDTTDEGDPGLTDLGNRVQLVYQESTT